MSQDDAYYHIHQNDPNIMTNNCNSVNHTHLIFRSVKAATEAWIDLEDESEEEENEEKTDVETDGEAVEEVFELF